MYRSEYSRPVRNQSSWTTLQTEEAYSSERRYLPIDVTPLTQRLQFQISCPDVPATLVIVHQRLSAGRAWLTMCPAHRPVHFVLRNVVGAWRSTLLATIGRSSRVDERPVRSRWHLALFVLDEKRMSQMAIVPASLYTETRNRHRMLDILEEIKLWRSGRRWCDNIKFDIRRVGSTNRK